MMGWEATIATRRNERGETQRTRSQMKTLRPRMTILCTMMPLIDHRKTFHQNLVNIKGFMIDPKKKFS